MNKPTKLRQESRVASDELIAALRDNAEILPPPEKYQRIWRIF